MSEHDPDLERLARTPVPPPSEGARRRAVAAAAAAFDRELGATQGKAPIDRLTTDTHSGWWRQTMQNRLTLGGLAAGALVVPLAAVLVTRNAGLEVTMPQPRTVGQVAEAPLVDAKAKPRSEVDKNEAERFADDEAKLDAIRPSKPAPAPKPEASALLRSDPAAQIAGADAMQQMMPVAPTRDVAAPMPAESRDRFVGGPKTGLKVTAEAPVSTFSIDADTASYSWVRRALSAGRLPSPDEVRVEELVNYFPYDYALPEARDKPFRPTVTVMPTPWNARTKIVHIGIKGFDLAPATRPRANLVFLVDTSGSMGEPDKLPLVQSSLKLLLDRLAPDDRVGLVTYAGSAGVALEPTPVKDRARILTAIDGLGAGGSTAGAAGIETAYDLARRNFIDGGVNRVVLATDGDFNVGPSDDGSLTRLIERERQSGVFLSVLGFGEGNYNDGLMQRLAQNGNGTAAYIDSLAEAQKVLSDEASATLFPVAKDVKIQVEFNPATVSEYRLIGYETRMLDRTDFNNDKIDAGEVGAGTAVTALYEITPAGSGARLADDLRYGAASAPASQAAASGEYGYLKIRYKLPDETASRLIETPIGQANAVEAVSGAGDDQRFALAVAAFGQKLAGASELQGMRYSQIVDLAEAARGRDEWGYRSGFLGLVRLAKSLSGE